MLIIFYSKQFEMWKLFEINLMFIFSLSERGAGVFSGLHHVLHHDAFKTRRPRDFQPHHHDLQPSKTLFRNEFGVSSVWVKLVSAYFSPCCSVISATAESHPITLTAHMVQFESLNFLNYFLTQFPEKPEKQENIHLNKLECFTVGAVSLVPD